MSLSQIDPLIIILGMSWFIILVQAILQWHTISAFTKLLLAQGAAPSPPIAAPVPIPVVPTPTPGPAPAPLPQPAPAPRPEPPPPPAPSSYAYMWANMRVLPQHQATVDRDARTILAKKSTYQGIEAQNGVPWYVIGLLDMMESGGGADSHLHNGDPLRGRTIHVPAGRPPPPEEPPFTFEQSALDALAYEGFDRIKDWSISGIAGALERYNGMGYHARGVPSPYLWSFSNQYTSGKYVADHVYDPSAVSQQAGAMPILQTLATLDNSIKL